MDKENFHNVVNVYLKIVTEEEVRAIFDVWNNPDQARVEPDDCNILLQI